ncbi:MAG: DUF4097 family beta strand repeat protein [Gemmatimonadetes bacterium]|nr:DUF4097 family beta strand repeat protein [Gemmatimonadota bacterium]
MPRPSILPLLALLAAPALEAQSAESIALKGADVAIYNLAGVVRVERGSGRDVSVEVRRGGNDGARLKLETGEVRGRQALRIVYDADRVVYPKLGRWSNTTINVASDGTFGDSRRDSEDRWKGWRPWGRGDRVRISGNGDGMEAWADLVVRVPQGVTLRLRHAVGEVHADGTDGRLDIDVATAAVDVANTKGALVVDAGSGAVSVTGSSGEISLDLGSGSARLSKLAATDLAVDVGSGGVTGDNISVSGRFSLDAGSGSCELTALAARRSRIDVGSGGLRAEFATDVDDLDVDAGSGSVTLGFPDSVGAEVDIETGSGGISSDFAVQVNRTDRHRLVGTVGDGKGRIHVGAGSGGVRLRKLGNTK